MYSLTYQYYDTIFYVYCWHNVNCILLTHCTVLVKLEKTLSLKPAAAPQAAKPGNISIRSDDIAAFKMTWNGAWSMTTDQAFQPGSTFLNPLMIGNHPFRWSNGQFSSLSLSAVHHPIPLHHRRGYLAGDAVQQRLKDERRFTLVSPHLMKPSLVPTNSSSFCTRTVNLQDRRFEPDWTLTRNYEIIQFNLATFSSDSPYLSWTKQFLITLKLIRCVWTSSLSASRASSWLPPAHVIAFPLITILATVPRSPALIRQRYC